MSELFDYVSSLSTPWQIVFWAELPLAVGCIGGVLLFVLLDLCEHVGPVGLRIRWRKR